MQNQLFNHLIMYIWDSGVPISRHRLKKDTSTEILPVALAGSGTRVAVCGNLCHVCDISTCLHILIYSFAQFLFVLHFLI